jgi:hypothetical protein
LFSLEMRAGELIRRLISGELTNYEVVRTSPEPLHYGTAQNRTSTCSLAREYIMWYGIRIIVDCEGGYMRWLYFFAP